MSREANLGVMTETTPQERRAELFNTLFTTNLNEKCEKKNGLSYISWANAWSEFLKVYPTATYRVLKDPNTNLPYFSDPNLGIMVFTQVNADGLIHEMQLPVMDSSNKAMRTEPYTYQVWDKYKNAYVDKRVEAATMTDINRSIMRCLTKNLAMFGLGLYIYAGEDIPEDSTNIESDDKAPATRKPVTRKPRTSATNETPAPSSPAPTNAPTDRYAGIKSALDAVQSNAELLSLYRQHQNEVESNPAVKKLFTQRKQQLQQTKAA